MGRRGRAGFIGVVVSVVVAVSAPGLAQWLRYPTEGIPRTADGKPNLTAPAPRLPDGKPDLSGIWTPRRLPPAWTAVASSDRAAAPPADHRSAATWVVICLAVSSRISPGRRNSGTNVLGS